jgi:NADH-quinone oxidoreductase subunit G
VQRTERAVFPPGDGREEWAIIRALSDALGRTLPYDTIDDLRARLRREARLGQPIGGGCPDLAGPSGDPGAMSETAFASPIRDFWRTDPISRASETMAECSALFAGPRAMAAE